MNEEEDYKLDSKAENVTRWFNDGISCNWR